MKNIGIVYGMENTFPGALVDRINSRHLPDVRAEHIHIGGIRMAEPSGYAVSWIASPTTFPSTARI